MPNKHRPGYHREWQRIRRKAVALLIQRHKAEFIAIEAEIRQLEPSN